MDEYTKYEIWMMFIAYGFIFNVLIYAMGFIKLNPFIILFSLGMSLIVIVNYRTFPFVRWYEVKELHFKKLKIKELNKLKEG